MGKPRPVENTGWPLEELQTSVLWDHPRHSSTRWTKVPRPDQKEAAEIPQLRGRTRLSPAGKALALGCAVSMVVWAVIGWAAMRYFWQ
jgi:hypothetical protein